MSNLASASFKVAATLAAYRIVALSTSTANTVKYPASVAKPPIGITQDTVLDITQAIPVAFGGIQKVYFNDTCTTGTLVAADSSGRAVPYVDNTAGGYVVGKLIGPTVSATGTVADVLIQPHWKIIT